MRLFVERSARRVISLAVLLFFTVPFGLSIVGCGHKSSPPVYCSGGDTGPTVGQLVSLQLSPNFAVQGESLNYGQIGSALSATGYDCKGNNVAASHIVYGTSNMNFADVNPSNGQACGGTWNRNTSGGVPNYTTCTPPTSTPPTSVFYITATSGGITSNAIPVYVHPIITSIVFGPGNCSTDPDTTCCPASPTTVVTGIPLYTASSCVSQNHQAQVAVRAYTNNDELPADNITCQVGHFTFGQQGSSNIVTFDQNGVATAGQPGSVSLTAALANSSSASSVGFFSTCPPANIQLSAVGQGSASSISVPLNNVQPFTITVTDTNNNPITGLGYELESTTPQTIPVTTGSTTPAFPGTATITAVCNPPSCNPAPFSQLGFLGNGKPLTSNGIEVTSPGASSTVIYVGSTQSQYILPVDFSTGLGGSLVKLAYIPNSMVISQDGSTIYMGSSEGLMTFSTASNAVTTTNALVQGTVLAVSPDNTTVVVSDPTRQVITLVVGSGTTTYNGVATHAAFTPDSQTLYLTLGPATGSNTTPTSTNLVLTHSNYTNWQPTPIAPSPDAAYNDVTVMVPAIGAYFAGTPNTDGRSYCALTTTATPGTPPTESNLFTPLADSKPVSVDRITATADGNHILGASATTGVSDIFFTPSLTSQTIAGTQPSGPQACTNATSVSFATTTNTVPFTGVAPTQITGVDPASNADIAFVTFNGTGNGLLPYYLPTTSGPAGTLKYFTLSTAGGTPAAPVAGVFSTDNFSFYLDTAGDNLVHIISVAYPTGAAPTLTDSSQINPRLPDATGTTTVTPNLIVQRPKRAQS